MNVLVLCHGNINRSPLCAAVLDREGISVQSAGFAKPNLKAALKMREAALALGLNLDKHRSRVITPELYIQADLIITMDNGNLTRLLKFEQEHNFEKKVPSRCLAFYGDKDRIPDPAFIKRGPEFNAVVKLIYDCSMKLTRELNR